MTTTSLYPAENDCPCGSKRQAQHCCIPLEPPVAIPPDKWTNLNLDVETFDLIGRRLNIDLPENLVFEVTFRHPSQLDQEIEELVEWVTEHLRPPENAEDAEGWVEESLALFAGIVSQLYALRYHQKQFFARLRIITARQAFSDSGPRGRLEVRFDDKPLRHELQGYLISLAAMLDPLGKFGLYMQGKKPENFGKFCELLAGGEGLDPLLRKSLKTSIEKARNSWLKRSRQLRNRIVHEGTFEGFIGVGQRGHLLLDARVGGERAGAFCLSTWKRIRILTEEIVQRSVDSPRS